MLLILTVSPMIFLSVAAVGGIRRDVALGMLLVCLLLPHDRVLPLYAGQILILRVV